MPQISETYRDRKKTAILRSEDGWSELAFWSEVISNWEELRQTLKSQGFKQLILISGDEEISAPIEIRDASPQAISPAWVRGDRQG
jgi:hypothetical protein